MCERVFVVVYWTVKSQFTYEWVNWTRLPVSARCVSSCSFSSLFALRSVKSLHSCRHTCRHITLGLCLPISILLIMEVTYTINKSSPQCIHQSREDICSCCLHIFTSKQKEDADLELRQNWNLLMKTFVWAKWEKYWLQNTFIVELTYFPSHRASQWK